MRLNNCNKVLDQPRSYKRQGMTVVTVAMLVWFANMSPLTRLDIGM